MAELKTQQNDGSVADFISSIDDQQKQKDSRQLLVIFNDITGELPKLWGTSIIGYGQYHYKSERSRQEGDWMLTGFSPRKASLSLYLTTGFEMNKSLLQKLGKHKLDKGCLYINKLSDVDETVLRNLIKVSYQDMKRLNGGS